MDEKYAKDINDCDECPLINYYCKGGAISDGSGMPLEPPCTSWDDDTLVYEGMYDC
jgi:hypothetical protein